jgi:hypothetical protein
MAIRTISNSGGAWNSASSWVENQVPTSSDDVVATATSGNLLISATTGSCKSIDFTNYINTFTISGNSFSNGYLKVYGNIKFVSSMTSSQDGHSKIIQYVNSSSDYTVETGGKSFSHYVCEDGGGSGKIILQDNISVSQFEIKTNFDTNDKNISSNFSIAFSGASKNVSFGSSNLSIGYKYIYTTDTSNILDSGTSTITLLGTMNAIIPFYGGNKTYNNIVINNSVYSVNIYDSNAFNNFTITAPRTVRFQSSKIQTINGDFTITGDSSNSITLNSTTNGSQFYLFKASGTVTASYCVIKDSNAGGGATWSALDGTNTDGGDNFGWLFPNFVSISALPLTLTLNPVANIESGVYNDTVQTLALSLVAPTCGLDYANGTTVQSLALALNEPTISFVTPTGVWSKDVGGGSTWSKETIGASTWTKETIIPATWVKI